MRSSRAAKLVTAIALVLGAAGWAPGGHAVQPLDLPTPIDSLISYDAPDSARALIANGLEEAAASGDSLMYGRLLNNLGVLEWRVGDVGAAADYFDRAFHYNMDNGRPVPAVYPGYNESVCRIELGEYEDAERLLVRLIRVCEDDEQTSRLALVLAAYAEALVARQRWQRAATAYRRALVTGKMSRPTRSEVTLGLAGCLMALDSVEVATGLLRDELAGDPDPWVESNLNVLLSKCLRDRGRPKAALPYALRAAGQIAEANQGRLAALLELSQCYGDLGRSGEALATFYDAADMLDDSGQTSEGHVWREIYGGTPMFINASRIVLEHPADTAESQRVAALFDVIERLKARTLVERITRPRQPISVIGGLTPVTIAELQSNVLEPGELLLDFAVGDEETYLFAIMRHTVELVRLPGRRSDFRRQTEIYNLTLGAIDEADFDPQEIDRKRAAVGDRALGKIDYLIDEATRLIVVPDSYFGALPFAALAVSKPDGSTVSLIDRVDIEFSPSVAVLASGRARKVSADAAPSTLVLAPSDPVALPGAASEAQNIEASFNDVDVVWERPADAPQMLTAAARQVVHVAAHVLINDVSPWQSGILLGAAEAPERGPLRVRRGFSPRNDDAMPHDPYLRASEIAKLQIPARLAVLAGCESALGQATQGEGVLGLASAFLSAGVSAVVATLWAVDDEVTAELMDVFYARLAEEQPVGAALRGAQLAIRNGHSTGHPYYWAAFVVVGDGTATVALTRKPLSGNRPPAVTIGVIAIVILLAGIVWIVWIARRLRRPVRGRQPG